MSLSPHMCDEIITDVIRRHQRQIMRLQSMVDAQDPDWEERFRNLLRLEADLIDIRQGLQAAAYVALVAKEQAPPPDLARDSIAQKAISNTAIRRFRTGNQAGASASAPTASVADSRSASVATIMRR